VFTSRNVTQDDIGDAISILGHIVTHSHCVTHIPRCAMFTVNIGIAEHDGVITHLEVYAIHGSIDCDTCDFTTRRVGSEFNLCRIDETVPLLLIAM